MTITEFLLERIAEDEEEADWYGNTEYFEGGWTKTHTVRVLRECTAKRAMIEFAKQAGMTDRTLESDGYGWDDTEGGMLKTLAAIYVDHPDYKQEWAV